MKRKLNAPETHPTLIDAKRLTKQFNLRLMKPPRMPRELRREFSAAKPPQRRKRRRKYGSAFREAIGKKWGYSCSVCGNHIKQDRNRRIIALVSPKQAADHPVLHLAQLRFVCPTCDDRILRAGLRATLELFLHVADVDKNTALEEHIRDRFYGGDLDDPVIDGFVHDLDSYTVTRN